MNFLNVLFAIFSTAATVKAAQAQNKAIKSQERANQLESARSRRMKLREVQLARASATATAFGAGSFAGSGLAGGLSSLSSQGGEALGFSTQMSGLSRDITRFSTQANTAKTLSGIGADLAQTDWKEVKGVFTK